MIINWSSRISSCYKSCQRHLQSKYDNMCVNETQSQCSQSRIIADFEELRLNKMLFGLIDIRQPGLSSYQRHKKAVYHAITAYFAPSLPPYQILTHNLRGS